MQMEEPQSYGRIGNYSEENKSHSKTQAKLHSGRRCGNCTTLRGRCKERRDEGRAGRAGKAGSDLSSLEKYLGTAEYLGRRTVTKLVSFSTGCVRVKALEP